jgi:hypothetical protein
MAFIKKITCGFVIQEYDTEKKQFVSQQFFAGDQVDFEDDDGNPVDGDEVPYLSFDMVPPAYMIQESEEALTQDQEVEERRIK